PWLVASACGALRNARLARAIADGSDSAAPAGSSVNEVLAERRESRSALNKASLRLRACSATAAGACARGDTLVGRSGGRSGGRSVGRVVGVPVGLAVDAPGPAATTTGGVEDAVSSAGGAVLATGRTTAGAASACVSNASWLRAITRCAPSR